LAAKLKRNYSRYRSSRCYFGRADPPIERISAEPSLKRATLATRAQVSSERPEERRKSAASSKRASDKNALMAQFPFLPLRRGYSRDGIRGTRENKLV